MHEFENIVYSFILFRHTLYPAVTGRKLRKNPQQNCRFLISNPKICLSKTVLFPVKCTFFYSYAIKNMIKTYSNFEHTNTCEQSI